MELHQIRYVMRVAETRNFSQAARTLLITQPTLTQQVAKLEAELGVRLFSRTTRSVSLTNAGRDFVIYGSRVLDAELNLLEAMGAYRSASKNLVRVGVVSSVNLFGFTRYLADFSATHNDTQLEISQSTTEELAKELLDLKVDIAFINAGILKSHTERFLDIKTLMKEDICAILPQNHPMAQQRTVRIEELSTCEIVTYEDLHSVSAIVVETMHKTGYSPRIGADCSNINVLLQRVTNGMISFLPPTLLLGNKTQGVSIVPMDTPCQYDISVALVKERKNIIAATLLRDFILDAVAPKEV